MDGGWILPTAFNIQRPPCACAVCVLDLSLRFAHVAAPRVGPGAVSLRESVSATLSHVSVSLHQLDPPTLDHSYSQRRR